MSKSRQTITIDPVLLEKSKEHARRVEKMSLSGYIAMLINRDMKKAEAIKPQTDVDERLKAIEGELHKSMADMARLQSELYSAHKEASKSKKHAFSAVPQQPSHSSHSGKSASA